MEGLTNLLLISIFDALLARAQSGRFSASWGYTPLDGLSLDVRNEDGTELFVCAISSRTLNELRYKLSAEATGAAKP